jgi:hypothetical protein
MRVGVHRHMHRHSHLMEYVMYSACDAHRVHTKCQVCVRARVCRGIRKDGGEGSAGKEEHRGRQREETKGGREGGREEGRKRESEELERYHDDDLPLWDGDGKHILSWSGDTGLRNTD